MIAKAFISLKKLFLDFRILFFSFLFVLRHFMFSFLALNEVFISSDGLSQICPLDNIAYTAGANVFTRHGQNQQRPVVKKLQRPFFLKKPLFYNGSRKRIKIIFLIDGTYVKFQGDHFGAKNVHF